MIDSIDEQLIKLLSKNVKQSSLALAKQLNLGSSTIRRRINKLIKEGTIRTITVPQPEKVGLPLRAIITFDVDHESLNETLEALNSREEITWLSVTTGRFDIIAIARFVSTDELFHFMEREVAKLKGVRNSETFVCLHVKKQF